MELPSSSLPHVGGLDEEGGEQEPPPTPEPGPLFTTAISAIPLDGGPEAVSSEEGMEGFLSQKLFTISGLCKEEGVGFICKVKQKNERLFLNHKMSACSINSVL